MASVRMADDTLGMLTSIRAYGVTRQVELSKYGSLGGTWTQQCVQAVPFFVFSRPLQFQRSRSMRFDADRYAAPDLASANAWRFGFDPDRQGGSVARFAALDDLGLRQPTVAASDGRFYSANDGLPESSRNRIGRIPSDQRGFRCPNRIGSYQ